ncbi:MAG: glycosyltransferase family 4 protein, partial [Acidobacteriota bacterium]
GKVGFVVACGLHFLWRVVAHRERYDLVHVHESDGAAVVAVWWLLRRLGLMPRHSRLVATLQVSYDEERRQVRPVFADGVEVSRPTAEELLFKRKARLQAFLGRLIVRLADAVVAPSRRTAEELQVDYRAKNVRVIHNGIATASFEAPADRPLPSAPLALYVGRMRTRKAVAVLLAAFRRVLDRMPEARLVLVGTGEQHEALKLQWARLKRDQEDDSVVFTGQVDREQMGAYYSQATLYCLPSLYEGLPLAILEAMAAGLPVVATDVSGNPEAVEDGETGLLVKPERAEELAEALVELLGDPRRAARMGRAGREKLEDEFTIRRIVEEYRKLWRELADGAFKAQAEARAPEDSPPDPTRDTR